MLWTLTPCLSRLFIPFIWFAALHRAVKIPPERFESTRFGCVIHMEVCVVSSLIHSLLRKCVTNRMKRRTRTRAGAHESANVFPKYDILFSLYWAYDNLLYFRGGHYVRCTMCVLVCVFTLLNCRFRLIRAKRKRFPRVLLCTTIHSPAICHMNVSAALLLLNYYQILYLFVFYFISYFFHSAFFVLILKIFRKMSLDICLSWNEYDIVRIKFKDSEWSTHTHKYTTAKYVHKRRTTSDVFVDKIFCGWCTVEKFFCAHCRFLLLLFSFFFHLLSIFLFWSII